MHNFVLKVISDIHERKKAELKHPNHILYSELILEFWSLKYKQNPVIENNIGFRDALNKLARERKIIVKHTLNDRCIMINNNE